MCGVGRATDARVFNANKRSVRPGASSIGRFADIFDLQCLAGGTRISIEEDFDVLDLLFLSKAAVVSDGIGVALRQNGLLHSLNGGANFENLDENKSAELQRPRLVAVARFEAYWRFSAGRESIRAPTSTQKSTTNQKANPVIAITAAFVNTLTFTMGRSRNPSISWRLQVFLRVSEVVRGRWHR